MSLLPIIPPVEGRNLYDIITGLSLTTNLRLVLDAGASECYGGSGETLTDLAGTHDFWFGATDSVSGDEPAFNGGVGGTSSSEYFSVDGGDHFRAKSQPSWVGGMCGDGGLYTIFAVSYLPTGVGHSFIGTLGNTTDKPGFLWSQDQTAQAITHFRGGGAAQPNLAKVTDNAPTLDDWGAYALTIDEAGGANASFFWKNGAYDKVSSSDKFDAALSVSYGGAAWGQLCLFARGNGLLPSGNGCRIACLAVWEGGTLTKTNLDDIWTQLNGDRGYV